MTKTFRVNYTGEDSRFIESLLIRTFYQAIPKTKHD